MRVHVYASQKGAVGQVRMAWPADAVARLGVDVVQADGIPMLRAPMMIRGRLESVIAPQRLDADVVVIQRPSSPELVSLIRPMQAQGTAVVVDVDDDLASISVANRARGMEDPRMVLKACALADLVTVSTPALAARYGGHGRVRVVPNCVPEKLLDMPRYSTGMTVGWAGFMGTHPGDLEVTRGGVAMAVRETGAEFRQVGPVDGVQKALLLDDEPAATGGLPVVAYHGALGTLDVGVCPLADTRFNAAKSGLKPLEMAARGAAVVMSPRADYARLAEDGIGVLAGDRARNWRVRVTHLLRDPELRREVVERSKASIRATHTYETQAWRWLEAWSDARQIWEGRRDAAAVA